MTDTATAPAGGITVSPDALRDKLEQINEVDSRLDLASDSKGAGKRAIANQLVTEHGDNAESIVTQVSNYLSGLDNDALVGVYTKIVDDLKTQFNTRVDEYLSAQAEARKNEVDQTTLSEDEVKNLSEQRKRLADEYKALRQILEMFGQDVSGIPEPKSRRGGRGKRGPRASSQIQWTVDGENLAGKKEGKFANVADTLGFEGDNLRTKAKNFRNWIETNVKVDGKEVDLSEPPATMSFEVNGHSVTGVYEVDEADAALEEDDDEDETD